MFGITSKRDKILNPYRKEAIAAVRRYIEAVPAEAGNSPEVKIEKIEPHSAHKNSIQSLEAYFSISREVQGYSDKLRALGFKLRITGGAPQGMWFEVADHGGWVKVLIPGFYTLGTKALEDLTKALDKASTQLQWEKGGRVADVAATKADTLASGPRTGRDR
jgi:hypothetical protein